MMNVDLNRNFEYYQSDESLPCECAGCRNFIVQIEKKFPEINEYLLSLNVDICRPLELIWGEIGNENKIEYWSCQYVVFGSCENDFVKTIGNITFTKNINGHPSTGITEEHFVLDFGTIILDKVIEFE